MSAPPGLPEDLRKRDIILIVAGRTGQMVVFAPSRSSPHSPPPCLADEQASSGAFT
jgi:hypothetical protein